MVTRYKNWAPRLGIAYRLDEKTVIRTGFGISYTPFSDNTYAYNYPVRSNNYYTNVGDGYAITYLPSGSPATFQQGFPALAIQEAILGPDHPNLIDTIYKLAFLMSSSGRPPDAEHLLYRAAAIREKVSGPDNTDLADLLGNLAALLLNEGKNAEGEPLLRRALAIQERTVGPNHRDTGKSLNDLPILLDREGNPEQSVPLFERALAIYRTAFGPQSQEARSVEQLLNEVLKRLKSNVLDITV
jgi:tetratricopeptide (TPR) repeat protein